MRLRLKPEIKTHMRGSSKKTEPSEHSTLPHLGSRRSQRRIAPEPRKQLLESACELLHRATLILPKSIGGLDAMGTFSPSALVPAFDCSGIERQESSTREPRATFSCEISKEDADEPRYLLWFAPDARTGLVRKSTAAAVETLDAHTKAVVANATAIASKLFHATPASGEPDLAKCLVLAARWHDLGKNRAQWQRNLGNLFYNPREFGDHLRQIWRFDAPAQRPGELPPRVRLAFGCRARS